ncbi:flagellar L-ring protein [Sphaerotilus natans subsp. natans DSM 6575]|uniref:Flagellar L-ring protein n=2 Tax=Sphaerotilus natans TaxID=34103 RepID=A0A059KQS3_9BURK|nr:flagellar basal body L-ring protein FlgH [Sphaerotilus natans]KDB53842.1 flagellar L-ring protein [Sphaerotilus natans subsp. natans DSM 6575]
MIAPASRRGARGAALAASAGALLLAGCQTTMLPTVAKVDMPETPVVRPYAQPAPVRANGAIYQASQYRPLFEDHRARLVGDTITVQIIERVSASSNSTSTVEKKGELSGSITALPMLSANSFTRAGVGGSSANTFSGKGGTQNSNNFSGTITATVVDVLPNGHLIVAGEKQIGVNDNVDVLRFSGQIDPRVIQPGNQVASAQIANVRVEQKGRGGQADAQQIGWLSRFFLNLMPI